MKNLYISMLLCHIGMLFGVKSELSVRSYADLKSWHMRSRVSKEADADKPADSGKNKDLDFTLPQYDMFTKQLMICDIFEKSTKEHRLKNSFGFDQASQAQIDAADVMVRDLELLAGDGAAPSISISSLIDRTHSAAGSMVYRKMLILPLALINFKEFESRQKFIKRLAEDKRLFDQVSALCSEYADSESIVLSNWTDLEGANNAFYNRIFFTSGMFSGLNRSPLFMESWTHAKNLLLSVSAVAVGYELDFIPRIIKEINSSSLSDVLKSLNPLLLAKNITSNIANNLVDERAKQYLTSDSTNKILGYAGIPTLAAAYLFMKGYNITSAYDILKSTNDMMQFMQKKLMSLASLVRSIEKMDTLQREYPELSDGLMAWQYGQKLLKPTKKNDFTTLIELLKTDTFTGESSFFSRIGRIMSATKFVEKERDRFAGVIELMGELDACLSVARLYKEYKDRRVNYCFAEVAEEENPRIELKNFWNPFVDYNVVVANDISLGGDNQKKHVILTGSNTGGKSTVGLRGIFISVYLAHAFGISPASQCKLSRFNALSSYLHISDDITAGESAFQAEINRTNSLLKIVKEIGEKQFAFIIIDELFKGTSPEQGIPAVDKVVRYLASFKNIIFILATHYKELTALESEIPSIVNMKIEVLKDENDNLIKPYKLEKGVNRYNIAEKLLEKLKF